MSTDADIAAIAGPLKANLKRALESLAAFSADPDDLEALGRLSKAAYLAGLGTRQLAAISIADEDFAHMKAANALILNPDI